MEIQAKYDKAFAAYARADYNFVIAELAAVEFNDSEIAQRAYQILAESYLELKKLREAFDLFLKAKQPCQAAFAAVLKQDLETALKLYEASPPSIAKKWGLFLCALLNPESQEVDSPGFLILRLFLESTLNYFIKNRLNNYLQRFQIYAEQFDQIYPEYRKSLGAAYLVEADYKKSIFYLNQALQKYDFDAEIYFKLGQNYMLLNQKKKAMENFRKVLKLLPNHIASTKYLEQMESSTK